MEKEKLQVLVETKGYLEDSIIDLDESSEQE
jgi:hypothetical protein